MRQTSIVEMWWPLPGTGDQAGPGSSIEAERASEKPDASARRVAVAPARTSRRLSFEKPLEFHRDEGLLLEMSCVEIRPISADELGYLFDGHPSPFRGSGSEARSAAGEYP